MPQEAEAAKADGNRCHKRVLPVGAHPDVNVGIDADRDVNVGKDADIDRDVDVYICFCQ